ncbi:MAG: glycine cleavage system protein GcvH [Muribaculaceae bacterium]|nr:glycine cleavage system protein GcvH [Muribaculaceae bacterium]
MSKLYYSPSHEYILVDGNIGYVGISDFAQKQLGNVVYVDMPEQGDDIEKGEDFGAIESVKAASDLIAPVSGTVLEFNEELLDNPKLVNEDPMKNWIIKVELSDPSQLDELLDENEYKKLCESESH